MHRVNPLGAYAFRGLQWTLHRAGLARATMPWSSSEKSLSWPACRSGSWIGGDRRRPKMPGVELHGSNPRDVERAPGPRHFFLRGRLRPTTAWANITSAPFSVYGRDGAGGSDFLGLPTKELQRGRQRRAHVSDEHDPRSAIEAPIAINDLIIKTGSPTRGRQRHLDDQICEWRMNAAFELYGR